MLDMHRARACVHVDRRISLARPLALSLYTNFISLSVCIQIVVVEGVKCMFTSSAFFPSHCYCWRKRAWGGVTTEIYRIYIFLFFCFFFFSQTILKRVPIFFFAEIFIEGEQQRGWPDRVHNAKCLGKCVANSFAIYVLQTSIVRIIQLNA